MPNRLSPNFGWFKTVDVLSDGYTLPKMILMEINGAAQYVDISRAGGPHAGQEVIRLLDDLGIYGNDIVDLYNACGGNPLKIIALLRAYQFKLAEVTPDAIRQLTGTRTGLDLDKVLSAVQEALPGFNA